MHAPGRLLLLCLGISRGWGDLQIHWRWETQGQDAVLGRGERHHARFAARTRRRSLPRSGRGYDDEGRCYRRASRVRREAAHPAREAEIAEYLDPWTDPRVTRS
jgi:hypothetical protein